MFHEKIELEIIFMLNNESIFCFSFINCEDPLFEGIAVTVEMFV